MSTYEKIINSHSNLQLMLTSTLQNSNTFHSYLAFKLSKVDHFLKQSSMWIGYLVLFALSHHTILFALVTFNMINYRFVHNCLQTYLHKNKECICLIHYWIPQLSKCQGQRRFTMYVAKWINELTHPIPNTDLLY